MADYTETSTLEVDARIVGGGIAGLAAAAVLSRAGYSVIVHERSRTLGGRGATTELDGVKFNLGAHALYASGHGSGLFERLGIRLAGSAPSPGEAKLQLGNRLYPMPTGLKTLLATGAFSLREKLWLFKFTLGLQKLDTAKLNNTTVADWLRALPGSGRLALYLRTLIRLTTYADAPDVASAGDSLAQVQLGSRGGVYYLDDGWESIVNALRGVAIEAGARIQTQSAVKSVSVGEDGARVAFADESSACAKAIILAVPPDKAVELLGDLAEPSLARGVASLVPARTACLDIALKGLPQPDCRFALGLDAPLYYSVHSAAAKLGPEGVHVIHLMRSLRTGEYLDAHAVEAEMEVMLDRVLPGWRDHVYTRRYFCLLYTSDAADEL